MDQVTDFGENSSSTSHDEKQNNKLKRKYTRKSPRNVLDGRKVQVVRYKENDALKLKSKYKTEKSAVYIPFNEDFLISVNTNIHNNEMEAERNIRGNDTKQVVSPKLNAFQFMMSNRNKVIGSNSFGKDKKPETENLLEEIAEKKEKNNKRKAVFEEWAERKGSKKQKLAEKVRDEEIKRTMRERAKRLKNMIKIIDEDLKNSSHDESDHETKSHDKKKINSIHLKSPLKASISEAKEFKSDKEVNSNVDKSPKISTSVINESNKNQINTETPRTRRKRSTNVNEVNYSEKLPQTPINRPKRNTKSIVSNSIDLKVKEVDKNDTPANKGRQKRNQTAENYNNKSVDYKKNMTENVQENQISANKGQVDKHVDKIESDNDNGSDDQELNEISQMNDTKSNKKIINTSILSLKKNKIVSPEISNQVETNPKIEQIDESAIVKSYLDDSNEDIFPVNTSESKKKTRQLKLFQDSNSDSNSSTSKKWKMKVRLLEKENINDQVDDVIIVDDKENLKKSKIHGTLSNFFDSSTSSEKKKDVKLAPLFLKKTSNKQTKAEIEAKRNFLFSGMPSQCKKIAIEQQSPIEIGFELFPKISHVQQKSSDHFDIWDLPNVSLSLIMKKHETCKITYDPLKIDTLTNCNIFQNTTKGNYESPLKLPNLKEYIKNLKEEYPNYPVFKTFRLLHEKYINQIKVKPDLIPVTKSVKKRRGRSKNTEISAKIKEETRPNEIEFEMWTEKYKPLCQDDIIGNYSSVKQLKCWLQSWVFYSEDRKVLKRRKLENTSSDDFCNNSDTGNTGELLPQNVKILIGPNGTGKTASVYALCNELNINVIEINASTKRTGKRILTELQEATQSHQVKNTDSKSEINFFQKKIKTNTFKDTNSKESKEEENKKLSLLLMEDVDIVFDEQDDGFISSLTTLVTSSKRPIILTTSDKNCLHLQKLISQHDVIEFITVSCKFASPWLQILSLIEGIRADKIMIEQLLEWNKGDIRKTILQLQFWIKTGGDSNLCSSKINNSTLKLTKDALCKLEEENEANDENSNLSWFESENSKGDTDNSALELENKNCHRRCIECFMSFYEKDNTNFQLSFPINLGNIWWNYASILHMNSIEHKNIFKNTVDSINIEKESDVECSQNATKFLSDTEISNSDESANFISESSKNKNILTEMQIAADFFESLVFTDTIYSKLKIDTGFEPTRNYWQINPINSLLLIENQEMYNESFNLSYEISQWLVENNIKKCQKFKDNDFNINVAVPDSEERRWRTQIHTSMEDISNIIPTSYLLDRASISKDYFPFLRIICRAENSRSTNNTKRKNRFFHYFKTFNIHLSDSTFMILCNSLATSKS